MSEEVTKAVREAIPPASFNLEAYELQDVCKIYLKTQRGDDVLGNDGKPVYVELWSPGSEPGVKALHRGARSTQLRMMRTFRGEIDAKDAENADREQVEKLTAFTKGFSANFPVTPQQVYSNPRLRHWKDQVEKGVSDYGNF